MNCNIFCARWVMQIKMKGNSKIRLIFFIFSSVSKLPRSCLIDLPSASLFFDFRVPLCFRVYILVFVVEYFFLNLSIYPLNFFIDCLNITYSNIVYFKFPRFKDHILINCFNVLIYMVSKKILYDNWKGKHSKQSRVLKQ